LAERREIISDLVALVDFTDLTNLSELLKMISELPRRRSGRAAGC
jgi:hypothetical protein